MRLLFDDRLSPMTSEIGFLEADAMSAASAFANWQRPLVQRAGLDVEVREIPSVGLELALHALLPLTVGRRRRFLFVPTQAGWSAFFDSDAHGTDVFSAVSFLAQQIGCRGLRVAAVPHTVTADEASGSGRYGAAVLEIYGPTEPGLLNIVRSIEAVNDGGKWVFDAIGEVQSFEDLAAYKARRVRDRFTFEMLDSYVRAIGLDAFDEAFYLPDGSSAVVVELVGPADGTLRELTLEEARAEFVD
jgi:hypothetical protein